MPAPTFTNYQIVPQCNDTGGGASVDETNLDRGQVHVNTNCCRKYGINIAIDGHGFPVTAPVYQGTLSTCSNTSTGMKVYSSDDFRICGSVKLTGTHSGSGTVTGMTINGTGGGTATVSGVSGAYNITVNGTFSNPLNGSGSGTITGFITGTYTFTVVGGVVTTIYTLAGGGTATGSSTYVFDGLGGFTFTGAINGTTGQVRGYWRVEWSGCSTNEMLLQLLNNDDDSLIAEYINNSYCLKSGRITMLNRKFVACDHPCIAVGLPQKQSFARHALTLCVRPAMTMAMCNANSHRDKLYTMTLASPLASVLDYTTGLSFTSTGIGADQAVFSGLSATGGSFTSIGTVFITSLSNPVHNGTYFGVAVTVNFTGSGTGSVRALAGACGNGFATGNVGGSVNGFTSGTATFSGGGIPIGGLSWTGPVGMDWSSTLRGGVSNHNYCSGNNTLAPLNSHSDPTPQITLTDPNFFGAGQSLTAQIFFDGSDVAPSIEISQSGTMYP